MVAPSFDLRNIGSKAKNRQVWECFIAKFLEANQEFYDTLGFTPDEVIGKKSKDVILLDESFRTNSVEKLKKDGSIRNVETIISSKNNDGNVHCQN